MTKPTNTNATSPANTGASKQGNSGTALRTRWSSQAQKRPLRLHAQAFLGGKA